LLYGVEGGVNSISEGEQEDSTSGGGLVRESDPPTIESKDSILQDIEGDKEKIAFLSVDESLRVGYVAWASGRGSFFTASFFGFLVHLGFNSIRQIFRLFSL